MPPRGSAHSSASARRNGGTASAAPRDPGRRAGRARRTCPPGQPAALGTETMAAQDYETGLARNPANHQPLTPLLFMERAAAVFPDHLAVVHGPLRRSYRELRDRCVRLASA